jgi:predicted ArsR family transcriptional regulator
VLEDLLQRDVLNVLRQGPTWGADLASAVGATPADMREALDALMARGLVSADVPHVYWASRLWVLTPAARSA